MQDAAARKLREDEQLQSPATPRLRVVEPEEVADRRTVTITGNPNPVPRRRPSPTQAQIAKRPDRVALWAFLLGLFLVFVAAATAQAAPL
jgi:hypothetical protein